MQVLFVGDVLPDYHQIYLCDGSRPALPDDYSAEAMERRVVAGPHAIIVHVERELAVPVRVELHHERPAINVAVYDHVAQTAVHAPTGFLILAGLLDDPSTAPQLAVPTVVLGAVVVFEALNSLSDDGLDGEDRYTILLWPEADADPDVVVLKQFSAARP